MASMDYFKGDGIHRSAYYDASSAAITVAVEGILFLIGDCARPRYDARDAVNRLTRRV